METNKKATKYYIWRKNESAVKQKWMRTYWTCDPDARRPIPATRDEAVHALANARRRWPGMTYKMLPVGEKP